MYWGRARPGRITVRRGGGTDLCLQYGVSPVLLLIIWTAMYSSHHLWTVLSTNMLE